MKTITIGDLHGLDSWKKAADIKFLLDADKETAGHAPFEPEYDYYIFLGDYMDSFTESNATILHNLKEVIRFKKLYPDNVITLFGNHELHYVLAPPGVSNDYRCSGYDPIAHYDYYPVLRDNIELFQAAFQIDNYLWTHAGVHKGWYTFRFQKDILYYLANMEDPPELKTLADELNFAFDRGLSSMFAVGHLRGGSSKEGGPLWLDKRLGSKKPLPGYHQIVGHTAIKDITVYIINEDTSIIFVDVLQSTDAFYTTNHYVKKQKETSTKG